MIACRVCGGRRFYSDVRVTVRALVDVEAERIVGATVLDEVGQRDDEGDWATCAGCGVEQVVWGSVEGLTDEENDRLHEETKEAGYHIESAVYELAERLPLPHPSDWGGPG